MFLAYKSVTVVFLKLSSINKTKIFVRLINQVIYYDEPKKENRHFIISF